MNTTTIGKNIKNLRDERGMTQQQLSEIFGVSYQTISKWESGITCPDISLLPDIADYFEVYIDTLFTLNKQTFKNKADRLAFKYGSDIDKSDVYQQADIEFNKIFSTSDYDHVDLKNYAYLNTCRMKYHISKAEKYHLDAISMGENIKDETYYRTLTAYILFLSKLGRAYERIAPHKQMLKSEPNEVFNHITLIFVYVNTDNYKEALSICQNALKLFPDNVELTGFMGDIQNKLANFDHAVEYWNKALMLDPDPDWASIFYSLAFYYRDNNQPYKAIETFEKILSWLEAHGYRDGKRFVKNEIYKLRPHNAI